MKKVEIVIKEKRKKIVKKIIWFEVVRGTFVSGRGKDGHQRVSDVTRQSNFTWGGYRVLRISIYIVCASGC
jgi:hypothetical protein